jgi:hypothetical protein
MSSRHEPRRLVKFTVVLDESLAEHLRVQAFEARQSRSAYVRNLIAADAAQRRAEPEPGSEVLET